MTRSLKMLFLLVVAATLLPAGTLISEGFDDISTLAASGFASANYSIPLGVNDWFQGNAGVFAAQSGAPTSYIAANYLATDPFGGTIDLWGFTPVIPLDGVLTMTFYTRTEAESLWPDRLQVLASTNGASTAPADFFLALDINPGYIVGGYPEDWTQLSVQLTGLSGTGRFAFRYFVQDVPTNGDYIGIDTLEITRVPEPAAFALAGLGLVALGLVRRRKQA